MTGEQMKAAFAEGRRVYGMMLGLARNPRWARVLGGSGLDYVIIDTEHCAFSRSEVADMIAALKEVDLAPLVRVPIPDAHYVTMALDAGAHGVLAPYCETVDQVKEVVGAARWRPLKGALLDRVVESGEFPSPQLQRYLAQNNRDTFVIIGIESVPAVENLEAILAVGGIDAIFIGPHDLSCSLGIPEIYGDPLFEQTVTRILDVCTTHSIPVAAHFSQLDLAKQWAAAGMRLVLYSSDIGLLPRAIRDDFAALREQGS